MLPSGRRCVARLVRLPLSCFLGLLLTSSAVLFLPATSWALLPTSSAAGPLQTPLTRSTPSPSTLGLTAFAPPSSQPGPNLTALQALEQAKLTGFDAAGGGWFGFSVALSGDTALVGAPYKKVGGRSDVGMAYVYTWSGTSWSQQAELSASDAATNDCFGWSVALSGDTALVSAPSKTAAGLAAAGIVYVFTRSGTSWSQQAELSASDATIGEGFGNSVALSGDTALMSAPQQIVSGQRIGAAYVFTGSGTSWSQQAELTASDATLDDPFGFSIALSGDTALVGDPAKGAAYVFARSGTSWSQQAELTASDAASGDGFGFSVALSGDTALVGAEAKTVGGQYQTGAAYIVTRSGTSWSQQAELSDPEPTAKEEFGFSVALSGATALIGAPHKTPDISVGAAGAAYVYTASGTSWPQQAELSASDAVAGDEFGDRVALSDNRALVGAPYKTLGYWDMAGAAYVDVLGGGGDDTLNGLSVSAGTLSPSFSPTTLNYTDSVANSVSSITVTPTTNDAAATYALKVGGVTVSNPIALSVGANTIDVVVTAQDGSTSETYVVTVSRAAAPSSDDTLRSLAVSAGTLSPSFAPTTLNYTDSVANSVSSMTVTPTTNDSHASCVLKVIGAAVSNPIALSVGANTIDVVVTAQDGSTIETYVVTVNRAAAPSSDDTLRSLAVSAGTLSPSFAPTTLNYTDSVANSVSSITLTPTTNDSHASCVLKVGGVTVSNPIALAVGANPVDLVVTAQNGSSQTYVITVSRAAALITPEVTLKLSGIKKGVLKFGRRMTASGTVRPTSLAGAKVTLTLECKQHGRWLTVTAPAKTISAGGTYGWSYKPARKGSYRIGAAIAGTTSHAAAVTAWQAFAVK